MTLSKRYTIINCHIGRGSLFSQNNHAQTALWEKMLSEQMTPQAKKSMENWVKNPIEVILDGGNHKFLEDMYAEMSKIPELACAKFNESMEDLMGTCTAITLIATDRIVKLNNYARFNGFVYATAYENLMKLSAQELGFNDGILPKHEEAYIASKLAFMEKLTP